MEFERKGKNHIEEKKAKSETEKLTASIFSIERERAKERG